MRKITLVIPSCLLLACAGLAAAAPSPEAPHSHWMIAANGGPGVTFFTDSYGKFDLGLWWLSRRWFNAGAAFSVRHYASMTALGFAARVGARFRVWRLEIVPAFHLGGQAIEARREVIAVDTSSGETMETLRLSLWTSSLLLVAELEVLYPFLRRWAVRVVPLSVAAFWNKIWSGGWEPTIGIEYRFL